MPEEMHPALQTQTAILTVVKGQGTGRIPFCPYFGQQK